MAKYRLYIDEAGHHRYVSSTSISEQYLCLCGVVVEENEYTQQLMPRIEKIRSLFSSDPDVRPALHLADIVKAKGMFRLLNKPEIKNTYNNLIEEMIANVDFTVIAVVIDKSLHNQRYYSPVHPYHYCLMVMLERYCWFLDKVEAKGDVMAEARGQKEDEKLKQIYNHFYNSGTSYIAAPQIQQAFTTKDLKLKTKDHLIQGLELADLLANNAKYDVLLAHQKIAALPGTYTPVIVNTIQPKYFRNGYGEVIGCGKKML